MMVCLLSGARLSCRTLIGTGESAKFYITLGSVRESRLGEAGHMSFRDMGLRIRMAEVPIATSRQRGCDCARLGRFPLANQGS